MTPRRRLLAAAGPAALVAIVSIAFPDQAWMLALGSTGLAGLLLVRLST